MSVGSTTATVQCQSCGALVDEALRFCVNCGASLTRVKSSSAPTPAQAEPPAPPGRATASAVTAPTDGVLCSGCGERIEDGLQFCHSCGLPVASARPPLSVLAVPSTPDGSDSDRPSLDEPPILRRARREVLGAGSTRAALYDLGRAFALAGSWPDAQRYLGRALTEIDGRPPDRSVHAMLAIAAREAGKPLDATRSLLMAVASTQRPTQTDFLGAIDAVMSIQDPSLLKPFARSLLRVSGVGQALGCVALSLCGAAEEAANAGRRAADSAPKELRWALHAAIRRATTLEPDEHVALPNATILNLAEIAQQAGQKAPAARAARRVVELEWEDNALIGRAYAVLAETTSSRTRRASHLFEAGRNVSWASDDAAAITLLRAAIEAKPSKEAYWYLAESLRRTAVGTEPFTTDVLQLNEAKAMWEAGRAGGAPSQAYGWAYYVAALTEVNLAEIEDDDRVTEEHRWSALRWTLAGLVLGPDKWDVWGWATLAKRLRSVGARGAATIATRRVSELAGPPSEFAERYGAAQGPADEAVQDEIASSYYLDPPRLGELVASAEERMIAVGAESWVSMIKAWDHMRAGDMKSALARIRRAVELGDDTLQTLYALARALLLNGCDEEASTEASRLAERLSPVVEERQGWISWAAPWAWAELWLGHGERVEPLIERGVDLVLPGFGRRCELLLALVACALRRDDVERAGAHFDAMMADNPDPGTLLDAVVDVGFGLQQSSGNEAREFVDRAKRRLRKAYRRSLKLWSAGVDVDSALAELVDMCPDPQRAGQLSALLLAAGGRWRDAALAAQTLKGPGATRISKELLEWTRAESAVQLLSELADTDPAGARGVISSFSDAGVRSPAKLAAAWRDRLDTGAYWRLHELESSMQRGSAQRLLGATIAQLGDWPGQRLNTTAPPSVALAARPTPVALELGHALIPPDAAEKWNEWELFTDLIPLMREAIETETGITPPGVRVRGNGNLAASEYVILLSEAPFEGGAVPFGHRWVEVPAASAEPDAGDGGSVSPTQALTTADTPGLRQRHPLTGHPGVWVANELAGADGIDPLRFIIAQLAYVLRTEVSRFLTVDAVADLIGRWVVGGADPELRTLIADPVDMRSLTCVLRQLALDGLALRPEPLITALAESGGLDHDRVLASIRRQMQSELPGNWPGTHRVEVPEPLQEAASVRPDGALRYAPDSAWDLVNGADRFHSELGDAVAVVVSEPALAVGLRRLLSDEVPGVSVLAASEVTNA